MRYFKLQVCESLPYTRHLTQGIDNTYDLFYYLKSITTFKDDPPNTELIQTAKTLIENNWHGVSGFGDCDCLSVAALASLYWVTDKQKYVILTGNYRKSPSHVYVGIKEGSEILPFDLTRDDIGDTRSYKYSQVLPFSYC